MALAFDYSHIETEQVTLFTGQSLADTHRLIGGGLTYGFNLKGFAVEAGLVGGSYQETFGGLTSDLTPIQAVLQIGYTALF